MCVCVCIFMLYYTYKHTYIYMLKCPLSLYIYVTCYICICYPHICIYTIPVWSCIYRHIYSLQIIYSRIIALDMQMAGERNSAVHPLGPSDDCLTVLPILFGFPK